MTYSLGKLLNPDHEVSHRLCTLCSSVEVYVHVSGYVSWQEFHLHFLLAKGHEQDQAEQHVQDYETIPLDPDGKQLKQM